MAATSGMSHDESMDNLLAGCKDVLLFLRGAVEAMNRRMDDWNGLALLQKANEAHQCNQCLALRMQIATQQQHLAPNLALLQPPPRHTCAMLHQLPWSMQRELKLPFF